MKSATDSRRTRANRPAANDSGLAERDDDMIVVESAGLTHVGMRRRGNEDAFLVSDEMGLYVVSDGMGGHQAGEVASEMVVRTAEDYMRRFLTDANAQEVEVPIDGLGKEARRLMAFVNVANRAIYDNARSRSELRGMGATVAAICFTEDAVVAMNVGDSPIYLIRGREIEPLYVPHTVLAEQMALGRQGSERLSKEYGHMLTRAVGVESDIHPELREIPCRKDDCLVLCSDGLSNKVEPEELVATVTSQRPARACQMLVDLANERGGEDNITVVVVKVKKVHKPWGWLKRLFP